MLRLAFCLLTSWISAAAPLIIRHVNLVDLDSATTRRDQWVRIDDDHITAVGSSSPLVPREATVIDARGKFIMPGLIGTLDRAPHRLVAVGVTAVRYRGSVPESRYPAPRQIEADPLDQDLPAAATFKNASHSARALRAVTIDGAAGTSLEGQLGRIAPGYFADLILLTANPLEDVRNTRRLAAVILRGRLLDRRDLDKLLATP